MLVVGVRSVAASPPTDVRVACDGMLTLLVGVTGDLDALAGRGEETSLFDE